MTAPLPPLVSGDNGQTDAPPPYVLALAKMVWDAGDATELASLIAPAAFPDKPSRDLFVFLSRECPKGTSITTLRSAVTAQAKHCLPLFDELLVDVGTEAIWDDATNSYLAERVNDEGKRARLSRTANQILSGLSAGTATDEILAQHDRQRSAVDLVGDGTNSRFRLRTDEELEKVSDAAWVIDGVLPQDSIVAVVGQSASYKTFLVTDWCFHIRLGLEWHGRRTAVGDVVYLCGEGANGLKKRIAAWKKYHGITGALGVQFLTNALTLNDQAEVAHLAKVIQLKRLEPRIIVVDTLSRFLLGNENAAEDMGAFIRGCDELRRAFGATIVIVHHTGKDSLKGARGSSALNGAVDTEIVCSRDEGEQRLELICTKQKDSPEFGKLALEALSVAGSLVLKASGLYAGPLAGRNRASLLALHEADTGKGLSHGEWLKVSDLSPSTFNKCLNWLRANAYIKVEKGKYSSTDAGRLALRSTSSTGSPPPVHSGADNPVHSPGVYRDPGVDGSGGQDSGVEAA